MEEGGKSTSPELNELAERVANITILGTILLNQFASSFKNVINKPKVN